tara:strand:- start:2453 stop:2617 length:165 start_codon:yes stop_codon:yes gene_type:complete
MEQAAPQDLMNINVGLPPYQYQDQHQQQQMPNIGHQQHQAGGFPQHSRGPFYSG